MGFAQWIVCMQPERTNIQDSFSKKLFLATIENLGSLLLLLVIIGAFSGFVAFVIGNSSFESFLKAHQVSQLTASQDPNFTNSTVAVASVIVGTFAFIPTLMLFTGNNVIFGFLWGSLFSLIGITLAAGLQYLLGRLFRKAILRRNPGGLAPLISQKLSRAGIWPFALIRILPLAPFTIMNLIVGALGVSFMNFISGNILGSLIPIGAAGAFAYEFERIVRTQHLRTFALAVIVLATVAFIVIRGLWLLKRSRTE